MRIVGKDNTLWYFGCYGFDDLRRIDTFTRHFEITPEKISIFRTDLIHTKAINVEKPKIPAEPKRKCIGESVNKKWKVFVRDPKLSVENSAVQEKSK